MRSPYWFLDSRSLGFFRILLGIVALYTFTQMASDAAAFFGPHGVLPADFAWSSYTNKPWLFGLLFVFPESMEPVIFTFVVAFAGAVLLLSGHAARVGALLAWWAYGSLCMRKCCSRTCSGAAAKTSAWMAPKRPRSDPCDTALPR